MPPLGTVGVSCGPMSYFLTPHTIFLCGKDKYHTYGSGEFIIGGGGGVEYRAAHTERYTGQAEW